MTGGYDRIKDKRIVLWGVGILQTDLEGLYTFEKFLYYVDDFIQEKNLITVSAENIYSPQRLKEEDDKDLMVILCMEAQDDAVDFLKSIGLERSIIFWDKNYCFILHISIRHRNGKCIFGGREALIFIKRLKSEGIFQGWLALL